MAINAISSAARSSIMDHITSLLDAGTTDTGADLTGHSAAYAALLFSCEHTADSYGAASAGVATGNAITDESSATGGTADVGRYQNRDNTQVFDFDIDTAGAELNLNTLTITGGDTVSITSAQLTFPAA